MRQSVPDISTTPTRDTVTSGGAKNGPLCAARNADHNGTAGRLPHDQIRIGVSLFTGAKDRNGDIFTVRQLPEDAVDLGVFQAEIAKTIPDIIKGIIFR